MIFWWKVEKWIVWSRSLESKGKCIEVRVTSRGDPIE
jgi:hypothetical protein